jgi:hypothetical protein
VQAFGVAGVTLISDVVGATRKTIDIQYGLTQMPGQ